MVSGAETGKTNPLVLQLHGNPEVRMARPGPSEGGSVVYWGLLRVPRDRGFPRGCVLDIQQDAEGLRIRIPARSVPVFRAVLERAMFSDIPTELQEPSLLLAEEILEGIDALSAGGPAVPVSAKEKPPR